MNGRTKSHFVRYVSNFSKEKKFEEIPGPVSLPIFGTLYQYLPFLGKKRIIELFTFLKLILKVLTGSYKFDKLHLNGFKKYQKYGPIVKEQIVPNVNIVWLFKPEDIEIMFRMEGKYPQRRSHLALEKYRLDKPNVYNTGGLLPTCVSCSCVISLY